MAVLRLISSHKSYYNKRLLAGILLIVLTGFAGFSGTPVASKTSQIKTASTNLPIAKIGESIVCCPGDSIALDGWASIDIGGDIREWLWDLNGDGKTDTVTNTGELVMVPPPQGRSYIIHLQVKDNEGNISPADSAIVHVMKSTPLIAVGSDTTIKAGVRMLFNPTITTSCGRIVRYEWDFNDDGKPEFVSNEKPNTSRAFLRPGKYRIHFKVIDSYGNQVMANQVITVTSAQPQ